jgi:cellulose 1,4-beta-cellobiosidase
MKRKTVLDNVIAVIAITALAFAGIALAACEEPTDDTLPAPKNLTATAGSNSSGPTVTLTWTPVSGASYYAVYQSTDSTWSDYVILTNSTTSTTYTVPAYSSDLRLTAGTTYYYKVGAKKQYSNDPVGKLSAPVSVYIGLSGTTGISASALSESSIKVTWDAFTGASKYRIYRALNSSSAGEAVATINAPTTEYTDTSLSPSTAYYYRIAVIDS